MIIFESKFFVIESRNPPHNSRQDGGHIVISPKVTIKDRTEMTAEQAKEFIKLTMIAGEAMVTAMGKQGIEIGRINYQDNGNFKPHFHLHLYARAKNATTQPFGTTFITPRTHADCKEYFKSLEPLNDEDVYLIRTEIERLLKTEKYRNF